jgi:hypothetical protein
MVGNHCDIVAIYCRCIIHLTYAVIKSLDGRALERQKLRSTPGVGIQASPKGVRRSAGLAAIGLSLLALRFGYVAASSEITGEAVELVARGPAAVVRRDASPAEFRKTTNWRWGACGFFTMTTGVSFSFYWRLREYA